MTVRPTPRRPDLSAKPDLPTTAGLVLVLIASAMAMPAVVATPDDPWVYEVGKVLPSGWRTNLWIAASIIGVTALIIGINRYQKASRAGDRRGRWWADVLTGIAGVGAVIWAWPLWVVAANGM